MYESVAPEMELSKRRDGLCLRRHVFQTLFSNHIPDYRNLMNSYATLTAGK